MNKHKSYSKHTAGENYQRCANSHVARAVGEPESKIRVDQAACCYGRTGEEITPLATLTGQVPGTSAQPLDAGLIIAV